MKNGIVVIGTVFVDIKGYPFTRYIPGGRNAGRVVQVHGGVSRNVAEDIANVGLRPTFVTLVEDDGVGRDVVERLERQQVNMKYCRRVSGGNGTWLAIFDNSGDVVASISRRPDTEALAEILEEKGDEIFSGADAVAVEVDLEEGILRRVLQLAEKYGRRVFAVVSNMTIAIERRDLLRQMDCLVCNEQEAGMLFTEDYTGVSPDRMREILTRKVRQSGIPRIIVTMGEQGAAYADDKGESGICPALRVDVVDTTGAGDAFFAGVAIGLTYGKTVGESCRIGTRLAASVIASRENVCPRFRPEEFGLDVKTE